jgi:hypothetical protein
MTVDPRSMPEPGERASITPVQEKYIGLPPKPLLPTQKIVNPDGTMVFEYHRFLTQQYEWERRLFASLTGDPYPGIRPLP